MLRVLLVEDRPEFATLVSTLLADASVEADVEVVDGVAAGLAALEARSCDCVFLDFGGRAAELEDAVRRTAAAAARYRCSCSAGVLIRICRIGCAAPARRTS